MSGGGAYGSYETGVLWGFIKNAENPVDFQYDVVTGVSAGSINAIGIGLWEQGQEDPMIEWMSKIVENLSDPTVFVDWEPYGIVTGILDKSSIFNDDPLLETLEEIYRSKGSKLKRRFVVNCIDANNGATVLFDETCPNIPLAGTSSSSIPAVFPDRIWPDGVVCLDGGTAGWGTNVASAV